MGLNKKFFRPDWKAIAEQLENDGVRKEESGEPYTNTDLMRIYQGYWINNKVKARIDEIVNGKATEPHAA